MMKHFSLKTEWFDVGDCATMTVVWDEKGNAGKWERKRSPVLPTYFATLAKPEQYCKMLGRKYGKCLSYLWQFFGKIFVKITIFFAILIS